MQFASPGAAPAGALCAVYWNQSQNRARRKATFMSRRVLCADQGGGE